MEKLSVKSPAFEDNGLIPEKYTCDGNDTNPPLKIGNIPLKTQSLALLIDDPDAFNGIWNHWVVWNISPQGTINENGVPGEEGLNSFNRHTYGGPCPPSGTHRYLFTVYALDTKLKISISSRKKDLEAAMSGHILAKGELVGKYARK